GPGGSSGKQLLACVAGKPDLSWLAESCFGSDSKVGAHNLKSPSRQRGGLFDGQGANRRITS
ncbi:MAG: hypothetical protein KAT79_07320, partial [candidate division Zixibacteria bacterium]|nr:hypothetical protein [candidate division Zixibacteria bacterium]